MIEQIHYYLSYDFVRNALIAGSLAGILGAVVGYFVVIRKVSFAAHCAGAYRIYRGDGRRFVRLEPAGGNADHFGAGGRDDGRLRESVATQRHGHWHDALALPGRGHVVSHALQRFRGSGYRHPLREYFWRLAPPNCSNAGSLRDQPGNFAGLFRGNFFLPAFSPIWLKRGASRYPLCPSFSW